MSGRVVWHVLENRFSVAKKFRQIKRERHQIAIPLGQGKTGDVASSIPLPLSNAGGLHSLANRDTEGLPTENSCFVQTMKEL